MISNSIGEFNLKNRSIGSCANDKIIELQYYDSKSKVNRPNPEGFMGWSEEDILQPKKFVQNISDNSHNFSDDSE